MVESEAMLPGMLSVGRGHAPYRLCGSIFGPVYLDFEILPGGGLPILKLRPDLAGVISRVKSVGMPHGGAFS